MLAAIKKHVKKATSCIKTRMAVEKETYKLSIPASSAGAGGQGRVHMPMDYVWLRLSTRDAETRRRGTRDSTAA